MNTLFSFLLPTFGYFFGAIPFGLMIGRLAGVDIRSKGSKNIGATNVSRVTGKKWGILTLFCDCGKGYLPMLLASLLIDDLNTQYPHKEVIIVITGIMAVLGHMFSVYLGFQGGKGVATGLGVFLFLSPAGIVISLTIFVAAVAFSGFVSVGSLLASGLLPLWLWLFGASWTAVIAGAIIAALIWFKHRENIARLLKGEEKSWRTQSLHSSQADEDV